MNAIEVCYLGMKELFENNPTEMFFNDLVIKDVKGLTFKIQNIGLVKELSGDRCDVVAKDFKGYRSFLISLEKNGKFPHVYKIVDVKEQKLSSHYQWRESI